MPLYEYECEACGYRFEVIQRFSDPAIDACQRCGGPVRKLLSPPTIQFKGSGWYVTDYARKRPAERGSSPTSATNGGGESSSAEGKAPSGSDGGTASPAPASNKKEAAP